MLKFLSINNIVLIDGINIDFEGGLCVLTGETGAGKSIILDSLGLVIGNRANSSLRPKNDRLTEVTALFTNVDNVLVKEKLHEIGISGLDEIILKRQLTNDGKSKAFINDHFVSLSTLKHIGSNLIEIESQFSEQGLLDSATHLDVLDEFGNYSSLLHRTSESWMNYKKLYEEFSEIKNNYEKSINEKDLMDFELKELENLRPTENEYNILTEKKKVLINSVKITENIEKILSNLSNENERGIEELLADCIIYLNKINDFVTPEMKSISKSLDSILIDIQEFKNVFQIYQSENNVNDSNLNQIEERIFEYNRLSKKHNCPKDELIKKLIILRENLKNNSVKSMEIKEMEEKLGTSKKLFTNLSKELNNQRIKYAIELDKSINNELPALKLENSIFQTSVTSKANFNFKGNNDVIFKIKTNKDSQFDEIKKISSGGELCRFALAIKVVASVNNKVSIVFDEVDSGIGGAVASAVGERLKKLSLKKQVIVVTHSPQVAALGNEHFKVIKSNIDSKTSTNITKLGNEERIQEIARMLSGKEITDEAKMAAIKLIED